MKKIWKNGLALFLAGIMALSPIGETAAATLSTGDSDVVVMEETTEETTVEETMEEDTQEESSEETASETESETASETEAETASEAETEIETETETEIETTTENETETETEAETEIEAETEVETETEPEIETEAETETEEIIPGLDNYVLSAEEKADRANLANYLSDIEDMKEGTDYVAGELIFLADTEKEAEQIAAAYGGELARYQEGVGVVTLPRGVNVVEALTVAATSERVVVPPAWPNNIYTICTETEGIVEPAVEESTEDVVNTISDDVYTDEEVYSEAVLGYNDPLLKQTSGYYQWQHAMVGSVSAWNAGYIGSGVKIAILDTGVATQTDLTVVGNYNMTTDSSATDGHGHGTHVAGLAAAKSNNSTFGAGIAPGASIINVKVLSNGGSGYADWIVSGINKAVAAGADIINMSLGGVAYNGVYAQAVKNAYNSGVVVFAAAGNDGSMAKHYPAAYPGAYAVGAVQQNKGRTYFSNYGSWVKFSAPGWQLYSLPTSGTTPRLMSGTSQATPVVSGTAAVILASDASIKNKTGKARVDALISKMNKGKLSGNSGAAGIVSLTKALGIPVSTATPSAPVFATKSGTKFQAASANIKINLKEAGNTIYYSTNGKAPTYKNGVFANATKYDSSKGVTITGSSKVTVQAIAVNSCGKVSKVAKAVYTLEPKVTSITITGQNVLIKGKSTTLKATAAPTYAKNKAVTWTSSDSAAVKVSNGKVTATKNAVAGKTYTITATAKDGSNVIGTFTITVKDAATIKKLSFVTKDAKTGKEIAKTKDTITRGSSNITYNVGSLLKVENVAGTTGKVTDVTWTSSNTSVADVNVNGLVTAKLPGKVTIKATAKDGSGKTASFTLTIKQNVTSITVSGLSQVSNGKSIKLATTFNNNVATLAPSNKGVIWSISPSTKDTGVTVDQKGTVKAAKTAKAGNYTVTATAKDGSGIKGTKVITVSDNAISSIVLDNKTATIFRTAGNSSAKTSLTIKATVTAKTAKNVAASSSAVKFTSSNPGVATVTASGTTATVKATGNVTGTTVITCEALDGSGKKATCKVTVVNPASKLTVTTPGGNGGYVGIGKTIQMSAVFEEELGTISGKKVAWSTSNAAIATVDKNGKVKGIAVGTATITATATDGSGVKASYVVYVRTAINSLALSRYSNYAWAMSPNLYYLSMNQGYGGYWRLCYNGKFANATDNNVYGYVAVEISNPDIVTAAWDSDADYLYFYANKKGTTKVTLKAMDGSGTKVTYELRVK